MNKAYVGISFYGVDEKLWAWFLRAQINTIKRINSQPNYVVIQGEMPNQLAAMFFATQTGYAGFLSEVSRRFDDLSTGETVGGFEGVQFRVNQDMPLNEIRIFID